MNKKTLLNAIVTLSPRQQEEVVHYVSTLKKNGVSSKTVDKTVDISMDMLLDDNDIFDYLDEYALHSETIEALRSIFEDAPSAEDLCAMLTK